MTSNDIRNVTFESAKKGYRAEDVDDFLQLVAREMETVVAEKDAALAEKDAAVASLSGYEGKMLILAQKVEEYRGQEDTLKTALINAQRMGETVVHEAKQKADSILREATGKAELLQQRAEREIDREQRTLERLREEVSKFRSTILNLYKQHIESLSALDEPMDRVEDFMDENPPRPPAETQPVVEETLISAEDLTVEIPPLNVAPAAPEALAAALPEEEPGTVSASSLFEGIPIDED